jgi:hypothetical protein
MLELSRLALWGIVLLGGALAIIGLIIAVMGEVQQGGKRRKLHS